VIKIQ
jgi:hypothetical protein